MMISSSSVLIRAHETVTMFFGMIFVASICQLPSTQAQPTACTRNEFFNDNCADDLVNNGVCDIPDGTCEAGSDCLDCDPCAMHHYTSCQECTAFAGCAWCASEAACFTTNYIGWIRETNPAKLTCAGPADIATTTAACTRLEEDNVFPAAPYYDAHQWIFEMIHIEPVWRAGISTYSVHCPLSSISKYLRSQRFASSPAH